MKGRVLRFLLSIGLHLGVESCFRHAIGRKCYRISASFDRGSDLLIGFTARSNNREIRVLAVNGRTNLGHKIGGFFATSNVKGRDTGINSGVKIIHMTDNGIDRWNVHHTIDIDERFNRSWRI